MKKTIVFITLMSLLFVIAVMWLLGRANNNQETRPDEQVFCTQDAMECPDGSYVGRVGPKCEFKACPGI